VAGRLATNGAKGWSHHSRTIWGWHMPHPILIGGGLVTHQKGHPQRPLRGWLRPPLETTLRMVATNLDFLVGGRPLNGGLATRHVQTMQL
jgi:hypothetical protein